MAIWNLKNIQIYENANFHFLSLIYSKSRKNSDYKIKNLFLRIYEISGILVFFPMFDQAGLYQCHSWQKSVVFQKPQLNSKI